MEVILLERIGNLGNLGDKVKVKPGYGRNYLVPQGKAVRATEANLADFEARRAELEKIAADKLAAAQARADSFNGLDVIVITARASDEGKLYGSINVHEVADAISAKGVEVERSEISLPNGPMRELGEFDAVIRVHSDVAATVNFKIEAE